MYLHIVMLELTPEADDAFLARVQQHCINVRAECANLLNYEFRVNDATRSGGFGHATVSIFTDSAAHDAYQISAAHTAMKEDMAPYIKRLVVFDGQLDQNRPT